MQKINNSRVSIIIFIGAVIILGIYRLDTPKNNEGVPQNADVKNISYTIDNEIFTLVDGKISKETTPSSSSKRTVMIFGEPVYGDLNGDGKEDVAVLLTSSGDGSGTFYYAALALATGTTYMSTNVLLLGDRIAPQTVEIHDGSAVYNYAERKAGEPMTTQPSVGKSLWVYYDKKTNTIGELVKNFEGEVDASKMNLELKKWEWTKTKTSDGKEILPKKEGVFTVTFTSDGKLQVGTDCNQASGTYARSRGNILELGQLASTKMFCEESQEQEFLASLSTVSSYFFTIKGELVLQQADRKWQVYFR